MDDAPMSPSWGPLHDQIIDAANDVYGVHPGRRALHAKGTLLAGEFTPSSDAARLSTAAHLQGEATRATVRFSNGSGDPSSRDAAQDGRGMAVKLYLDDGTTTDIVAISRTVFFVRNPQDFLDFMTARKPDPETGQPDMEKLGAWLGEHPEAGTAVQEQLAAKPPASYAQLAYHSIHAFRFTAGDGEQRWVRYRWEPEAGEQTLSDDDAADRGPDYLQEEISERVAAAPVAFRLHVRIAAAEDDPTDPTVAWPQEREQVEVGRLELSGLDDSREQGDDVLVFDPTRVTGGIECSDDQILQARAPAYSASIARRSASR